MAQKVKWNIEIDKTFFSVKIIGVLSSGKVQNLLLVAKKKLSKMLGKFSLNEDKIVLSKNSFFVFKGKAKGILEQVKADIVKNNNPDWKIESWDISSISMERMNQEEYELIIEIGGTCNDC